MEVVRYQNRRAVRETIGVAMSMNCICCDKPTTTKTQISTICIECNIEHERYYAWRTLGDKYSIEWGWYTSEKPYTQVYIQLKIYDDTVATFDGHTLFDVRTEGQLKKLLVLL